MNDYFELNERNSQKIWRPISVNVKGMLTNEHNDNCPTNYVSVNLLESLCRPSWISCNMWLTMCPLLSPGLDPQRSGGLREVSLQPSFTTRCTTGHGIQRLLRAAPLHPSGQEGACDWVSASSLEFGFEFRAYSYTFSLLLARCFRSFYRKEREHYKTENKQKTPPQPRKRKSFSWGPVFYESKIIRADLHLAIRQLLECCI